MYKRQIADNGRGFDPVAVAGSGGQGLTNMHERVARLGGRFAIDSAPDQPTTIRVRLGLPTADRVSSDRVANPV